MARVGRYAFMATTDAPKPTLAQTARGAVSHQTGEEEGSTRKTTAAVAPRRAKARSRRFR